MLPISDLNFCFAEELELGDFAILNDFDNSPVFVGQFHEQKWAVFLQADTAKLNIADVKELRGPAIRIPGFELEVDYARAEPLVGGIEQAMCLCARDDKLSLLATANRGLVNVDILHSPMPLPRSVARVFLNWRVIKIVGTERRVLFEHSAAR